MFQDLELIELLVAPGPLRQDHAAALFKNRLYRRWGIKTAREYAQIKIDGLRRGGNPDFTNAPGHGDDDARFYDRQQAYVHTPDIPPRPPGRPGVAPKPELTTAICSLSL